MIEPVDFHKLKKAADDPEEFSSIENWEDRSIELQEQQIFRANVVTQRLAEKARQAIEGLKTKLTEVEDMPEVERRSIFREKRVHEYYLSLFTQDPSEELAEIEHDVKERLKDI
jgi:hypothetical protein